MRRFFRPPRWLAATTAVGGVALIIVALANTHRVTGFLVFWTCGIVGVILMSIWFLKHP